MGWILRLRFRGMEVFSWRGYRDYMKKRRFLSQKEEVEKLKYNFICSRV
jgi:hypothetical protein